MQPAVTTAGWSQNGYESMADYRARIKADFEASASQLREQTGRAPRILVWPYGAFNQTALDLASAAGMPYTFTLAEGLNKLNDSGSTVRRYLLEEDTSLETLDEIMGGNTWERQVERLVHVDLDYVYDKDPQQMNKNIDMLLDRIKGYGITTVYLQAYADDTATGWRRRSTSQPPYAGQGGSLQPSRLAAQDPGRGQGVRLDAGDGLRHGPNHAYVTDSRTGTPAKGQYLRLSPWILPVVSCCWISTRISASTPSSTACCP